MREAGAEPMGTSSVGRRACGCALPWPPVAAAREDEMRAEVCASRGFASGLVALALGGILCLWAAWWRLWETQGVCFPSGAELPGNYLTACSTADKSLQVQSSYHLTEKMHFT